MPRNRLRRLLPVFAGMLVANLARPAPAPTRFPDEAEPGSPLAIFDALTRALQDNYPMLEYAGWNEAWVGEFRTKIAAAPDRGAAFELMDELVCRLNDYHTRLSWPEKPKTVAPAVKVVPVLAGNGSAAQGVWGQWRPPLEFPRLDDLTLAVTAGDGAAQPGDIVVAIDGVPVRDALAHAWRHAAAPSVAGKLRSAINALLRGALGSVLRLQVRRGGAVDPRLATLEIPRIAAPAEPLISERDANGIPVIRISRWRNEPDIDLVRDFDGRLERHRERSAIIIDVRGNGGGDDELAARIIGRFVEQPVIASISFRRQVPQATFERTVKWAVPRGPWRFAGKVVVLIDEGSMSATEHFVSGMAEAGALLCGTPTSGACGLIRTVELRGTGETHGREAGATRLPSVAARLNVSRTFPLHSGGLPSPMLGIVPHLWQPPALDDLCAGRDSALDAALAWLASGATLPARLQPVTLIAPRSE